MTTGCGNLYVTINEDDLGIFELFTAMGKAGGCASSQAEAISRLISLALRAGVDSDAIIRQLSGVRCPSPVWKDGEMVLSCADAIARALGSYLEEYNQRTKNKQEPKNVVQLSEKRAQAKSQAEKSDNPPDPSPTKDSNSMLTCPDCGSSVQHSEGCMMCRECGYSKCS